MCQPLSSTHSLLQSTTTEVVEYYQQRRRIGGGQQTILRDLRDALEWPSSSISSSSSSSRSYWVCKEEEEKEESRLQRVQSLFDSDAYASCASHCLDFLSNEKEAGAATISQYAEILHYVTLSLIELRDISRAHKFLTFQRNLIERCAQVGVSLAEVWMQRCVLNACALAEAADNWSDVSAGLHELWLRMCKYKEKQSIEALRVQLAMVQLEQEKEQGKEYDSSIHAQLRICSDLVMIERHAVAIKSRFTEHAFHDVNGMQVDLLRSCALRMDATSKARLSLNGTRHDASSLPSTREIRAQFTKSMNRLHENLHSLLKSVQSPSGESDTRLRTALHQELIEVSLLCLEIDVALGTCAKVVLPSSAYHLQVLASMLKRSSTDVQLRPLFVLSAQRRLAACLVALAREERLAVEEKRVSDRFNRCTTTHFNSESRRGTYATEADAVLLFLVNALRTHLTKEDGYECVEILVESLLLQSQLRMRVERFEEAIRILQEALNCLQGNHPSSLKSSRHLQERAGGRGTERLRVWTTLLAAECFMSCGRTHTAAQMLHELLRERVAKDRLSFPWRSLCLCGLAAAEFLLGLSLQAENRYREALQEESCGELEWCCARSNLAAILISQGQRNEAVTLLRSVVSFFRQNSHHVLGTSVEAAAQASVQLSEALHVCKHFEESIQHAERSMCIVWSLLTGTHSTRAVWEQCDNPAFTQHPLVRRAAKVRAASQRGLSTEQRKRMHM